MLLIHKSESIKEEGKFMLRPISLLLLISFCLFRPPLTHAQPALGQLAASMQPGSWAQLATNNIANALSSTDRGGGASGGITGYADSAVWDNTSRKLLFIGSDHNSGTAALKFVTYSADTNAWTVMPNPPWTPGDTIHGYDHNAIDTTRGEFYFRQNYSGRVWGRYSIATQAWTSLPSNNVLGYSQCCAGAAYFPELDGLVWAQAGENGTLGGVFLLNRTTNQWTRLGSNLPMGAYGNFAEYSPVHKVVIFGLNSNLYRLNSSGTITTLSAPPLGLGINQTLVTVDPVSGDFLVFGSNGSFYSFNPVTDQWTRQPGSNFFSPTLGGGTAIWEVVATPVSTYGITMFVKYNGSSSAVYLYKHSSTPPGNPVPPPATPTVVQVR